jgi:hypothetical protein
MTLVLGADNTSQQVVLVAASCYVVGFLHDTVAVFWALAAGATENCCSSTVALCCVDNTSQEQHKNVAPQRCCVVVPVRAGATENCCSSTVCRVVGLITHCAGATENCCSSTVLGGVITVCRSNTKMLLLNSSPCCGADNTSQEQHKNVAPQWFWAG